MRDASSYWIILWQNQIHVLTQTVAFCGVDTTVINVQVHIANSLSAIAVVGLVDKAFVESRERVCGFIIGWFGLATKMHCRKFSPRRFVGYITWR